LDHKSMLCAVSTQSVGTTLADGHYFVKQLYTVLKLLQQTANKTVRWGAGQTASHHLERKLWHKY
jgi:hypothetical protein